MFKPQHINNQPYPGNTPCHSIWSLQRVSSCGAGCQSNPIITQWRIPNGYLCSIRTTVTISLEKHTELITRNEREREQKRETGSCLLEHIRAWDVLHIAYVSSKHCDVSDTELKHFGIIAKLMKCKHKFNIL